MLWVALLDFAANSVMENFEEDIGCELFSLYSLACDLLYSKRRGHVPFFCVG